MKNTLIETTKFKPVDKQAAIVTSQHGGFQSRKKLNQPHSETPIPTVKFKRGSIKDLTGKKNGLLEVIGLYSAKKNAAGLRLWVVRCRCGRYEIRRSKSIQNTNNSFDACQYCRELDFLKRKDYFMRTGRDRD